MSVEGMKAGFFDRPAVINATNRAQRKVLGHFGGKVRKRARYSIPGRKGISPPGGPPYSHQGFFKKSILYAYDRSRKSVVIGPTFSKFVGPYAMPQLLEEGGRLPPGPRTLFIPLGAAGRDPVTGRFVKGKYRRIETTGPWRYRPRPTMQLAFEAEKPGFMSMWKDSLK